MSKEENPSSSCASSSHMPSSISAHFIIGHICFVSYRRPTSISAHLFQANLFVISRHQLVSHLPFLPTISKSSAIIICTAARLPFRPAISLRYLLQWTSSISSHHIFNLHKLININHYVVISTLVRSSRHISTFELFLALRHLRLGLLQTLRPPSTPSSSLLLLRVSSTSFLSQSASVDDLIQ